MTTAAGNASATTSRTVVEWVASMPRWVWSLAALLLIAIHQWALKGERMFVYLGDADDAARLVQVREFMAGAPWFDTTTAAMGGPDGLLSHWTRLIDLPLAAIIKISSVFMSVASAELVARIVWPLLVLAPMLVVIQRSVFLRSGEQAARIALGLCILLPLGVYQFTIGRIDHHNVMIAATVCAALLIWSHPASHRAWGWAGGLCGLALVVGYEALLPAALLAVLVAVWGLLDRPRATQAQAFVVAMSAVLAVGFLITIPPSRWMDIRCDAISLNMVALASFAGAAYYFAARPQAQLSIVGRFAIAGAGAGIGLVVYGWLEPKCLAGPMGQLPPDLKPIWLDYVAETRSILRDLFAGKIEQALGLIAFYCAAIAAQARQVQRSRSREDLYFLAVVVAFVAFACWQYKYISYASYIALVPIACWISTLRGDATVRTPALHIMATILLSQTMLLGTSNLIQKALTGPEKASAAEALASNAEDCEVNTALHDLNVLPAGRIAAHIDLGAYLIAETPHRALSAPYHRIADAIIANHRILAAKNADDAARILAREQVDYIVTCKGLDDPFVDRPEWRDTLRANLVHGKGPDYLERVPLPNPTSLFTVWRVHREKLNLQP